MLYITNHQANVNKNRNELSSYTCQNGYYKKTRNEKHCSGCGEKGTVIHWRWECVIGVATMEDSMKFPQKIKNRTIVWCSNSTSGYLSEENKNSNFKRYMFLNFHYKNIYNNQNTETTQLSISGWTDKEDVIHIYDGILLSYKKKMNSCYLWHHRFTSKALHKVTLDQEIHILCDFSYTWNLNTYKYIHIILCTRYIKYIWIYFMYYKDL